MLQFTYKDKHVIVRSSENKPIAHNNEVHSEYFVKLDNFKGEHTFKEL